MRLVLSEHFSPRKREPFETPPLLSKVLRNDDDHYF